MPHELRAALDDVATLATHAVDEAVVTIPRTGAPVPYRIAATEVVVPVVEAYGDLAATVAADWYDELRATHQIAGTYRAALTRPLETARVEAMIRWAMSPLFEHIIDWDAALRRLLAGSDRQVRNAGRDTVIENTIADPQAIGWQRLARPDSCAFCRMLADRGAVYSEHTVDFGAHTNCHCSVAPAWEGRPRLVRSFQRSERNITAADRARVRDWMRAHGYGS